MFSIVQQMESPNIPSPRLLIVHGFTEHGGHYRKMVEALAREGIQATTVDLIGHGARRGERPQQGDWFGAFSAGIEAELRKLRGEGAPLFLFGHSMGGTAVMNYLRRGGGEGLAGVVISSPCCGPSQWSQRVALPFLSFLSATVRELSLPICIRASILTADPAMQKEFREDRERLRFAPAGLVAALLRTGRSLVGWSPAALPPVLFQQGDDDRLCGPCNFHALLSTWPADAYTLKIWPRGRHELPSESFRDEYFRSIATWMHAVPRREGCRQANPATCVPECEVPRSGPAGD